MPKQDYSLTPGDGKNWGSFDYPPKGYHLIEVLEVEPHMNYEETDVVWDIEVECPDVGGTLTDKAGREKASSACLAAGFGDDDQVDPDELVGKIMVARFGDDSGVGKGANKLYRSILSYHPEDHEVTPEDEIDWAPPPREEAEVGKGRKPRSSRGRDTDEDDGDEDEKPKGRTSSSANSRSKSKSKGKRKAPAPRAPA